MGKHTVELRDGRMSDCLPSGRDDCKHPIWEYLADYSLRNGGHKCVDCGRVENDVPKGSVMVGHAPGECGVCDAAAAELPPEQAERWKELTEERRS